MIQNAEIIEKIVGLRPFRKNGIRLELDIMNQTKVIHNYGLK